MPEIPTATSLSQLSVVATSPRTAVEPPSRRFADSLERAGVTLLDAALNATASLIPGGSAVAATLRGVTQSAMQSTSVGGNAGPSAESPGSAGGTEGVSSGTAGGLLGGASSDANLLAQGQEMSMRMLRLQEAISEDNRQYTALSNVLHARHEMAKNAISNIR